MLVVVLAATLVLLGVRMLVLEPVRVDSGSMAPTLSAGDQVLVLRLGGVSRGDVVLARPGGAWGEQAVVKRVLGVGGDRLTCCDDEGRLVRNGEPVDEPYLAEGGPASAFDFDVEVPDGRVWLMGDDRAVSIDSRSHLGHPGGGMVQESDVVGRMVVRYWPPGRWGTPETTSEH